MHEPTVSKGGTGGSGRSTLQAKLDRHSMTGDREDSVSRSRSWVVRGILPSVIVGLVWIAPSLTAVASKVIAHGTLVKGHLIGIAEATAKSPRAVSFTITSNPKQMIKVDWAIVCAKHLSTPTVGDSGQAVTSESQEKEGVFSATTPVSRPLPLTVKHPTACIVNVYGTLSKRGTELIQILQD
jgi:hypothetical protein